MTPREPDRFSVEACAVVETWNAGASGLSDLIAAALRREHDAALDEAADAILAEEGHRARRVLPALGPHGCVDLVRALKSPAAASAADGPCCNRATVVGNRVMHCPDHPRAPAAEPRDVVTGTARETYAGIDFTRGAPLSEPAAPALSEAIRLVERIRATAKGHIEYFAGEIFSDANDALRILLATSPPGAGEGT